MSGYSYSGYLAGMRTESRGGVRYVWSKASEFGLVVAAPFTYLAGKIQR